MTHDDLSELMDPWLLRLAAERKSPMTLKSCREGVEIFLAWAKAPAWCRSWSPTRSRAFVG